MQEIYKKLKSKIDESQIFVNEPMSKHTSFKVGGPADIFIKVKNLDELKYVLEISKKEQVTIIGNGTNILVKDNGIRGIVVKLDFKDVSKIDEETFEVGAGVPLIKLTKDAYDQSLTGLEFASGIPGTIGGAVKMNAGAYGGEMKDVVISTTYLDENMTIKTIDNKDHIFKYRNSVFCENENYIIVKSIIKLKKGEKSSIKDIMEQNSNSRKEKQPINYPNAGSIFKRGDGYIPAKLIDEAGLKGYNIGGAYVSDKHAGFIVNKGNATAKDICNLIEHVKKVVNEKFGVELQLEIKILGE